MMRHLNSYQLRLILTIVEQKERIKEIDMKEKEIHNKAIRLLEGGIVEVDGHWVKLCQHEGDELACLICTMDSVCYEDCDMNTICALCDAMNGAHNYLKFAYEK